MARSKEVKFYKGKHYQGNLTDDEAEMLLALKNEYESVSSLSHCITDVPSHIIIDMKESAEAYEKANGSLEGYTHDYKQYFKVGTLRDAQTIGVAFMYYARSALMGDEVGLGKTVQVAGLCNVLGKEYANNGKKFRYCFLTEKTSSGQIRDKMMQFTGEFVGLVPDGGQKSVEKYIERNGAHEHYSIVGTHALLSNPDFIVHCAKHPFDLLIVDESRILKKASSTVYKNTKQLFKLHDRKILLNATPLEMNLREFYNQMDLLDPTYMPTVGEFSSRHEKKTKGFYGYKVSGFKNEKDFRDGVSLRYISRTRAGLGAVYEDNTYRTILVPQSEEQLALMKKTSLKQMVVDFPTGVDRNVPFNKFTTPKLAALLDVLFDEVQVGRVQALVYCHFKEAQYAIADVLREEGYTVVVLNGESSGKERDSAVYDYNAGMYDVMVTNVLRGIDVNSSDTAIMYSIDHNPQNMRQFEGRMTREFDIEGKSLFLLVAMGHEKKFVETELKIRVEAGHAFTTMGRSLVLDSVKTQNNREFYEQYSFDEDDTK